MIVLLTLFPIVLLELMYLSALLQLLDLAVATFIGNLLSVAAMGFLLIPLWPSAPSSGGYYSRDPRILRAWKSVGLR